MVSLLVASVLKCILVHGLNLLLVATLTAIHAGQVSLVCHPSVLCWLQMLSGIVNKSCLALLLFLFFYLVIVPILVSFNIISSFFFILLNHVLISFLTC